MNQSLLLGLLVVPFLINQETKPVPKPKQEAANSREAFAAAFSAPQQRSIVGLHQDVSISGALLLAVEAATAEFRSKLDNPKIGQYEILVTTIRGNTVVIFENPNRSPMAIGNSGPLPEFEVTLSKENKVIQSNFSR